MTSCSACLPRGTPGHPDAYTFDALVQLAKEITSDDGSGPIVDRPAAAPPSPSLSSPSGPAPPPAAPNPAATVLSTPGYAGTTPTAGDARTAGDPTASTASDPAAPTAGDPTARAAPTAGDPTARHAPGDPSATGSGPSHPLHLSLVLLRRYPDAPGSVDSGSLPAGRSPRPVALRRRRWQLPPAARQSSPRRRPLALLSLARWQPVTPARPGLRNRARPAATDNTRTLGHRPPPGPDLNSKGSPRGDRARCPGQPPPS